VSRTWRPGANPPQYHKRRPYCGRAGRAAADQSSRRSRQARKPNTPVSSKPIDTRSPQPNFPAVSRTALREMGEPDQRNGGFLNTTFEEYPITVSADMGEIDVSFIDELDPILNPVGIKGLGEASTGGVALPSSTRSSTPPGPGTASCRSASRTCSEQPAGRRVVARLTAQTRGAGPLPPASTNPLYGVMGLNTTTTGRRQPRPAYWTARQTESLHGHPLEGNTIRTAVAEAVGTFILVLTITSTAVAATLAKPLAGAPYDSLAVPLVGGPGPGKPRGNLPGRRRRPGGASSPPKRSSPSCWP
jgi:hypothetical protein